MTIGPESLRALERQLDGLERVAVAASGGVDSMTLAVVAHRRLRRVEVFHAVSPAVPAEATARVKEQARREGWRLHVVDAGEFADDDYLANPVDRCYFCKRNLYDAIVPLTDAVIVSGANLDDLGDYRPGLKAASEHAVRHPFVDAGIDKSGVRAIARELRLDDLAELPAAPCLSSRVETGIAIDPQVLTIIHRVERRLRDELNPATVRCRLRAGGVAVELDRETLEALSPDAQAGVCEQVAAAWRAHGEERSVRLEVYKQGSAFLH
jgi:uncharacterized protein